MNFKKSYCFIFFILIGCKMSEKSAVISTNKIPSPSTTTKTVSSINNSKTNPFTCNNFDTISVTSLKRLTKTQYSNTIKYVLGEEVLKNSLTTIDLLYSDTLRKNITDFSNSISDSQMTAYQKIAEEIYYFLNSKPTIAENLTSTCIKTFPLSLTCKNDIVKKLGEKLFRRPLLATEVETWSTNVASLGETGTEAVSLLTYGMLLTPQFLLKLELGDNSKLINENTMSLTPFEVATRLSYGLADVPPDAELYAAALKNQLNIPSQLSTHVNRLIELPEGKNKTLQMFQFWLDPKKYSPNVFSAEFLDGVDVNLLNYEFERELNNYLSYMIYEKKATFQDLMTSRNSFARAPASDVYGHAAVTNSTPAQTSMERKGLLMKGPVIATEGNETHPILRGVKVRVRYLCENLGLPSGVSVASKSDFSSDEAKMKLTNRERVEGITKDKTCMNCHSGINPAGFAFENFDSLGRVRNSQKAYDLEGKFLAQHSIDTESLNVAFGNDKTVNIADGLDLIDKMLEENKLPSCFIKYTHRFYQIKNEVADDSCTLKKTYDKLIILENNSVLEGLKAPFIHESILKRRFQ